MQAITRCPPLLLALLTLLFFAVRARHGIWFLGFVDESEHLLGGKMLNHGAILYRSFVSQHGPFTFMLTQAYGAWRGWKHPNSARMISVVLALLAAASVATTRALPQRTARLWAVALFLGLVSAVWLVQGFYLVNYHAIGGFLVAAALALCVVPAWCGSPTNTPRAMLAGACCTLTVATAYSFGPAMVLLGSSLLWASLIRRNYRTAGLFVAGAILAVLVVLAWMLRYADLTGFIAFHFVENQRLIGTFLTLTWGNFFYSLIPSVRPNALVHAMALLCCAGAVPLLLSAQPAPRWRFAFPCLLGFAGLLTLCARGGTTFHDGSFVISSIALFSMALPACMLRWRPNPGPLLVAGGTMLVAGCVAAAEFTLHDAVGSPITFTRAAMPTVPRTDIGKSQAPEWVRVRALVAPGERILAVPYAPYAYFSADRMPMDRYFYYLPWDAAYAKAPWHGQTHDLCQDLPKSPPKLIYFNHWVVWDRYDMHDYMPCFVAYLNAHYQRQTDFPDLYLRLPEADTAHAR